LEPYLLRCSPPGISPTRKAAPSSGIPWPLISDSLRVVELGVAVTSHLGRRALVLQVVVTLVLGAGVLALEGIAN